MNSVDAIEIDAQAAGRTALSELARDVRRRRRGDGPDAPQECTVVSATPLTLDGRRSGKTYLARVTYASENGAALQFDRPMPMPAVEIDWEGNAAGPLALDLVRSRRVNGRFEAAFVLRTPEVAAT